MDIAKIGNRTKRRKNVKLYEITIPAQTVRIEATVGHVALRYVGESLHGITVKEVEEEK
jgi:reverse gyrase